MTPNYLPFHKMKLKIKQELAGLKTFSFHLIYSTNLLTYNHQNQRDLIYH